MEKLSSLLIYIVILLIYKCYPPFPESLKLSHLPRQNILCSKMCVCVHVEEIEQSVVHSVTMWLVLFFNWAEGILLYTRPVYNNVQSTRFVDEDILRKQKDICHHVEVHEDYTGIQDFFQVEAGKRAKTAIILPVYLFDSMIIFLFVYLFCLPSVRPCVCFFVHVRKPRL